MTKHTKMQGELLDDMPHVVRLVLEAHSSVFQPLPDLTPNHELDHAIE